MQQGTLKQLSLLRISKNVLVKISFFTIILGTFFSSFTTKEEKTVSEKVNENVVANTTLILNYLDSIEANFKSNNFNAKKCQRHYEAARKHYKQIEFYIEYHFPFHSKCFINGPLVNKAEFEYGYKTFTPHGFQVIESLIYNNEIDSTIDKNYELALLKQSFEYIKEKSKNKNFKHSTTIDMLRFEVVRIMSLYLNGYDCTINKQNLQEVKYILTGFEKSIGTFSVSQSQKNIFSKIIFSANLYLSKNNNYDSLNRLVFITRYLKPLYAELYNYYDEQSKIEKTNYAINIRQKQFYDEGWFNTNYFSVVIKDSVLFNKQAQLGELLFFDPLLSGNNQRACASCHNPSNAFGGSSDFNQAFQNDGKLKRNTPSLLNVAFQKSFFYDGRSLQLEDQASEVLNNHKEMFSNPYDIVNKLKQSPEYKKLFREAYVNSEDSVITYYAILKSISEYERKLVSLNSRFDKYLRGDEKQLSQDEINGYNIFTGKALCGSCHFFPLFNGLVPPFYSDNEFEVIGVPKNKLNTELDSDSGRYLVSKNNIHLGAFKTLGLRHIDQTAPYMHNGIYNTIDEVIEFYQKGGGAGLGIKVNNQTLPFDSLQLNKIEIENLKKFLLSLTDKSYKAIVPKELPIVNIIGLEKRKVGGNY